MEHHRDEDVLTVRLHRDFNLLTARHLQRIAEGADEVRIDCRDARLIDSEGVMAMYDLQRQGASVTLIDPPEIFREVLSILDLEEVFGVEVRQG
jgi:anti-anti-sigma regulatory factor